MENNLLYSSEVDLLLLLREFKLRLKSVAYVGYQIELSVKRNDIFKRVFL